MPPTCGYCGTKSSARRRKTDEIFAAPTKSSARPDKAVRTAQRAEKGSNWHMHITEAQRESTAYALWLEARAHSV